MHKEVIELGIASADTKGSVVGGQPDEIQLQKPFAGIADD
jgi:hypothetical protein